MRVVGKALATIQEADDDLKYGPNGGFTCIASTPSEDRDGDNLYQEEWKSLPEHITVDLDHGMSVATTVGSGRPYFNSDGNIQTDVSFSSIPRAQEARTLIKEGHVRTVSVAFMTDKTKKSGEPRRELLNLGIVAVPSNREAVILDSKALDARAEEIVAEKVSEGVFTPNEARELMEEKDSPKPYGNVRYADPENGKYPIDTEEHVRAAWSYINMPRNADKYSPEKLHQIKEHIIARAHELGIHINEGSKDFCLESFDDFAEFQVLLHAEAAELETKAPNGNGDGAALTQAIHDASVHLGAACYPMVSEDEDTTGTSDGANKSVDEETVEEEKSLDLEDIKPEGMDMERFKSALTELLNPASEEPAPAEEAAAAPSADWGTKAQLLKMRLRTRL